MKRLSIVLFAAVLLAVGALQLKIVGQEAPLRDVATREAEAELMKSAQTAYEGILAAQEVDQAELSDLYAWSVRWLNAAVRAAATPEERLAAFRDHHDRVMVQHRNVEARWKHGVKGGEEFTYRAAIYYLREAELWLADAQNAQR